MSAGFSDVLWPTLSGVLAVVVVWLVFRQRRHVDAELLDCWQTAAEDAVKVIHRIEQEEGSADAESLSTSLGVPDALIEGITAALSAFGWIEPDTATGLRLTERGRERAQNLVRAHRLWEQYLSEKEGLPADALHAEAHRREHTTTQARAAQLDAELGHPAYDPHGHPIPDAGSPVPAAGGMALGECPVGRPVRVLDVADEPPALFAQLAAMGLVRQAVVQLSTKEEDRLLVEVDDRVMPVAASAAEQVRVAPMPALPVSMGELAPGKRAQVVEIRGTGRHQRRMLDMGLVPGAKVEAIRTAPLGDPVEYLVKGTAISMRRADADSVLVEEGGDDE